LDRVVSDRVFVIAEAGVNHNGSLDLAERLVDAAVEAGADAVKFQTFRAEELVSKYAPKAAYQRRTTGEAETQLAMVKKLELDDRSHERVFEHCAKAGIEFLSTPFDPVSVDALVRLGVRRLKVPSGEITNPLLLRAVARTGLPLIISTGMSTLEDVARALDVIASATPSGAPAARDRLTLLHCTTEYPAPLAEVNLRAMTAMSNAFGLRVGYSDHTRGTTIPIAAAALGACIVEKHFTLDRSMPGPDHAASLEPGELRDMVRAIRDVEVALGDGRKAPTASELPNMTVARRSLVAARAIAKGEAFTPENLTVKRPGGGLSAMRYDEWIGRHAARDFEADEPIDDSGVP
jgi:N-acetylneuraminate synthase